MVQDTGIDHDYVSPNLQQLDVDRAFPNMVVGDKDNSTWPFLRRDIRHKWYVDSRNPTVGFVSKDEASILYNTAQLVKGHPCLEIGCWRGWSTVQIARGSGNLEVIDPALLDPVFLDDVRQSLQRAQVSNLVSLHPVSSPDAVHSLSRSSGKRWAFAFIDGDHDNDAPVRDAEAVAQYAAEDAFILFHDLASPHVGRALDYLADKGWNAMVYQTMQIMGVAWRGNVNPIEHTPDPSQNWKLPDHLRRYHVSGMSDTNEVIAVWERRHSELIERFGKLTAENDANRSKLVDLQAEIEALEARNHILAERISCAEADRARTAESLLAHQEMLGGIQKRSEEVQAKELYSSQMSGFIEWATKTKVLLRLLRKRLTQPHERVVQLIQQECGKYGLGREQTGIVVDWLSKPRSLRRLLRRNLLLNRRSSRHLVARIIGAGVSSQDELQTMKINIGELTRLRSIELAKTRDEKLISDLYVELAILQHTVGKLRNQLSEIG
jgi:predicted O-methyltransferase YrrM